MEKLSRMQNQKYLYKNFIQQYFEHGLNGKDDLDTVLEIILYEAVPSSRVLTEEIKLVDNKEKEKLEKLVCQYEEIKERLIQSLKLNEEGTSEKIELKKVLYKIEKIKEDKYKLLYIKGAEELFEKVKTIQREAEILQKLLEDLIVNKANNRNEMIANAQKEMKKKLIDNILQELEIELSNLNQLEENQRQLEGKEQQIIEKIKEKSTQILVENPEFSEINCSMNAILPKDRKKSELEYQEQISQLGYQIRNYRTTREDMKKEDMDSIIQALEIEFSNLTHLKENQRQLEENKQQIIGKIKEKKALIPVEKPEFFKINCSINAILPKDRQKSKLEYQEQISEAVYQIRNYRSTKRKKEERADVERRIIKNASIIYNHLERFIVLNCPTNNNYYYVRGVSPQIKEKVQNKFNEMIADGKIKQRESGFIEDYNQYDEIKKNEKWAREDIYKVLEWLNEVEKEDQIAYYLLWLENKYIRVENEKYDNIAEKQKEQAKIEKVAEKFMEYMNKKEEKSSQRDSCSNEKLKRIAPKLANLIMISENEQYLGEK